MTIIDSDILIDAARMDTTAVEFLSNLEIHSELAVSAINKMELLVGCRNKAELRKTEKFLERFRVSDSEFYSGYHIARNVKTYGIRHEKDTPAPAPAPVAGSDAK